MNHYDHYTDEELMSFIKNDDVAPFRELYNRYWKQLLLKANHLLRSNQDAEDVVHDVFTDIWKRKKEIDLETSFRAYIGAAVNYSCLRKLAERKVIAINAESESADHSTQQYLSLRELQKRFNLALGELPEKCRLIFRMSREEGLSDKEIASKLQLSLPTIRTQIHRAITKLRWSLGQFLFLVFLF